MSYARYIVVRPMPGTPALCHQYLLAVVDRKNPPAVLQGVCARDGKIMTANEGATWGDILLSTPALRDMQVVRTMTYVEVISCTREDLEQASLCTSLCVCAR